MANILKELVKDKSTKTKLMNIRVTQDELDMLKEKAVKYAGGNVSAYIKVACRDFRPKKEELVKNKS